MENSLWKRLWTCSKTDKTMNRWMNEYPSKKSLYFCGVNLVTFTRFGLQKSDVRLCKRKQLQISTFLNSCRQSVCGSLKADMCVCTWVYIIKTHTVFGGSNSLVCRFNIYNTTRRITLMFRNYVYILV